ncbi:MAG: hypothetical protein ACK2UB_05390 [Anaerolineales bacterium]|jgi:hypothetical protein
MSFLEGLSMVLLIGGLVVLFVSFANIENLTGMWVAGDVDRDEEFKKGDRFRPRAYLILRWAGIIASLAGVAMMILMP